MTRDPIWDAMKQASRDNFDRRRLKALLSAEECDDGKWTKHNRYHWSRTLAGKRLDYWPSRRKFQWDGKVRTGDVRAFIRKRELSQ